MRKQTLFTCLGWVGLFALCGCASDQPKPSTPAEIKAFKGGPMPPAARKLFEESMRQSQKSREEHIAQSMANGQAGAAKAGGTPGGPAGGAK